MNDSHRDLALIYQSIQLDPELHLVACMDSQGEISYWVTRRTIPANPVHGCAQTAEHEMLGALPRTYQDRLRALRLRCGRPTQGGRRCRVEVKKAGLACHQHRLPTANAQDPGAGSSRAPE